MNMTKEEFTLEIDKAWDDYYNFHHELFGGPDNGCDDYRDLDEVDESYLTNLRKKAQNMEEGFFNIYGIKYKEYKDNNKKKMSPAEYIKYLADNHIKIELPEDNRKYPGQQCQDERLNYKFRQFHKWLVNQVIGFCRSHNITIDEFNLHADGLAESIPYGTWQSCTDSGFVFKKYSDEYKHAFWDMSIKDPKELDRIERENHEPFLSSM